MGGFVELGAKGFTVHFVHFFLWVRARVTKSLWDRMNSICLLNDFDRKYR